MGTFNPTYSTDNIWREDNMDQCLSTDLNTIESNITSLQTGKANTSHTHSDYATTDHTHSGYAVADHTHTGYASSTHTHSYNDLADKPTIPTGGGDADTVDGKHANEFATATDVTALQTLVGDTSVSTQISTAIATKADSDHTHDNASWTETGFMSVEDKKKLDNLFLSSLDLDATFTLATLTSNTIDMESYSDGYYVFERPSNLTIKIGTATQALNKKRFICRIKHKMSSFIVLGKTTYTHSCTVDDLVTGAMYMAVCTNNSATPSYTSINVTDAAGTPLWAMLLNYIDAIIDKYH